MPPLPTPRERFIAALERRPLPGRVPHFELVFFLTMEVFGKPHPTHRNYGQWQQMSELERRAHRRDIAQLYVDTARRFDHDAIFIHPNPWGTDEVIQQVELIREISGDRYFLMVHGDATHAIPGGQHMEEMSVRMAEEPDKVDADAVKSVDWQLQQAEILAKHRDQHGSGLDGFALCSDYCFNTGPFLPLPWFDRFVQPHLTRVIKGERDMGFYTIKHTDGNIMPILGRLVEANPHALHSLDPQGGVDMAQVVQQAGARVCLCGNVDCGKLQTGTDQECIASARYAITEGMKAPGYVFCTSNSVYTGMDLKRYELILEVWKHEAIRR